MFRKIFRTMMTDDEKTLLVQDCENFEELYLAFDGIKEVEGSQKRYTASRLKEKTEFIRNLVKQTGSKSFDVPFNNITRTHGIRAKVMELCYYEFHGI